MPSGLVLDSWPVLGWLAGEPVAGAAFARHLAAAREGRSVLWINIVNLGEIFYIEARRHNLERARSFINVFSTWVNVAAAPNHLVLAAAELKARHPIAYADAFAIATALGQNLPLLTGDPEILALAARQPGLRLEAIG